MRDIVEETLNELLEAEAEKLTQAARYDRNEQRHGYRSGHSNCNLATTSGDITLKVPKLKAISFGLRSLSGIAAGKVAYKKLSLRCTWQECQSGVWRIY